MKRLLTLLIVALAMTSCSMPAKTTVYYTDFTRYANEGVYVTPFSEFSGHTYRPIANLMVEHYIGGYGQEDTNLQEMADALVELTKTAGANGIMDFKVNNVNFTWYASGTAVIFDDMPSVAPTKGGNTHVVESGKPATPQINYKGDELIKRTVAYCIEREIEPFGISNKLWNNTTVYDLNAKRYIDEDLYNKKYGENASEALYKTYKTALKETKKKSKK